MFCILYKAAYKGIPIYCSTSHQYINTCTQRHLQVDSQTSMTEKLHKPCVTCVVLLQVPRHRCWAPERLTAVQPPAALCCTPSLTHLSSAAGHAWSIKTHILIRFRFKLRIFSKPTVRYIKYLMGVFFFNGKRFCKAAINIKLLIITMTHLKYVLNPLQIKVLSVQDERKNVKEMFSWQKCSKIIYDSIR